jgi:hypothetical protein
MNDEHRREVVERDDDGDRGNGVGNMIYFTFSPYKGSHFKIIKRPWPRLQTNSSLLAPNSSPPSQTTLPRSPISPQPTQYQYNTAPHAA